MNLFNAITKRKSTRKFSDNPLSEKELDEMITTLKSFELLYTDIKLDYRIISNTKGIFNVRAPHYLIISGQGKKYEKENAGFIGEKFVLWLHTKGIGSVWQGKTKEKGKSHSKNDIIAIAFGKTEASIERKLSEFKRKKIETITNAPEDDLMKAVHLAPSGINFQPWFFEKRNNKIVVYEQKLKFPISFFYKITTIDIGIALCHYAVASEHYKKPFTFKRVSGKSNKKGFRLFGEITTEE
ncbi:MAG: nitroreductase family protein [Bacilli bacterium]|jgi:hypothetical protein|nr:nitroreductase family protein [Bacilli bacterium]